MAIKYKYKAGDRVKLTDNIERMVQVGLYGFEGAIMTILGQDGQTASGEPCYLCLDGSRNPTTWFVYENCIVKKVSTPFKVGDKVRVIKGYKDNIGKTGIIVKRRGSRKPENIVNVENEGIFCNDSDIELVPKVLSNPYWSNICEIAEKQRKKGLKEYGHGLESYNAPSAERIQYIEEELVDALMYLEWLKDGMTEK